MCKWLSVSSSDRYLYILKCAFVCRKMHLTFLIPVFLLFYPCYPEKQLNFPRSDTSHAGMRSRDMFCRLQLRLRLRRSIPAPAPAPAPSKTFWRLRLRLRLRSKCTGSGGSSSGSGSGSDAQVLIWALTSNTIFKMVKYQNMTSY